MRAVEKNGTIPTSGGQALSLGLALPVEARNAGLFISRGVGTHPDRVIDTFELIFVREGVLHIQEEAFAEKETQRETQAFRLSRGQSLLLFPGRRHFGTAAYPANLSFYWLHFRLRPQADAGQAGFLVDVPRHASVARPEQLTGLFHRFLSEQEAGTLLVAEANLLVIQLLLEMARSVAAPPERSSAGAVLAGRAEIRIRQQFHQDLSASRLAEELGCNPDYLGRVFRQVYGHTLTEALLRCRVRHAKHLLQEAELSVASVAAQCGFHEPGYFRRMFKRYEGVTPGVYRRLNGRRHVITE
ncbi:AraC family transcriptional regulator [Deinococcus sp.]|uniref:helix-turn-helix transcriptional regulator n=1 Tax=Deinococcus sp. TaxID=47478 RepID=UPI003B5B8FDE